MKRFLFTALLYCIFTDINLAAERERPSQDITLTYKAYWAGFAVSEVSSVGHMDQEGYRATISYKVSGLATVFSKMANTVSVRGKFAPDGTLIPQVYENQGTWSQYRFRNRTEFDEQDGRIISHDYDFKFKEAVQYIPVKEELKYGPDMVSFYLGLTLDEDALKVGSEVKHQNVFGGFFLLDIGYHCPEYKQLNSKNSLYQGEALVCEFTDKVIDGGFRRLKKKKTSRKKRLFRTKKKRNTDTMEPVPVEIWYAKLPDLDHLVPVYSEFSIGLGKVKVYLSEIKVTTK